MISLMAAMSYAEEAVQVNLGDYRFEKAYVTVYFNSGILFIHPGHFYSSD